MSCKRHSTCTKKKAPGFCQRKALQQPYRAYLARGQTPPTDALAALIGIPPLILNTCPVFKMHLINEIGIRKTYADSRYRDRGPFTFLYSVFNFLILSLHCTGPFIPSFPHSSRDFVINVFISRATLQKCLDFFFAPELHKFKRFFIAPRGRHGVRQGVRPDSHASRSRSYAT